MLACRGRFTLSMYKQMHVQELIAANKTHYVDLVMKLLEDDSFWLQSTRRITEGFNGLIARNNFAVAQEWTQFLVGLFV